MQLTDRQRAIAGYFQLQAEKPCAEAALDLGIKEYTVRRELDALIEAGVLVPYPLIDAFRLGYIEYDLYFSTRGQSGREVSNLSKHLAVAPRISWLIEVGGAYQMGLTVLARSVSEARSQFNELSDRFPGALTGREISTCFRWTLFQRRYLSRDLPTPSGIMVEQTDPIEQIDLIDTQILKLIANQRIRRINELSRALEVPESTINYRVNQLRERKIYRGFVCAFEGAKFGVSSFRAHLWMQDFSTRARSLLLSYIAQMPNIVSLGERLGGPDFSMRIEVEAAEQVFLIGQELRELLGNDLVNAEILPIFAERKINLYPFLAEMKTEAGAQRASAPARKRLHTR